MTKYYKKDCDGCNRSQGKDNVRGGVVELKGDWTLNHYGGQEGFLGWMALQPRYHKMTIADLESDELSSLGDNIKKIDEALGSYWKICFNDRLERVYVLYFFESFYDRPIPTKFHLHIHLIPRPKSFDPLLREYSKLNSGEKSSINVWGIPKLTKYKDLFPEKYLQNEENVKKLMDYLRDFFKGLD